MATRPGWDGRRPARARHPAGPGRCRQGDLVPSAGNRPVDPADPLVRRALHEAQAAARLHHPGIVTAHDVVTDEGRPWIVLELINGRSLADTIHEYGLLIEQRTAEIGLYVLPASFHGRWVGIADQPMS